MFLFPELVFESADVSGAYKFPDLDLFNDNNRDQVSDYIQLPQKLLSKDKCK